MNRQPATGGPEKAPGGRLSAEQAAGAPEFVPTSRGPAEGRTAARGYIECPAEYEPAASDPPVVFLAGGITGCPDWQQQAARRLAGNAVVLNPRRRNFPIGDPAATPVQIQWEHRYLHSCDVTLFWFPACDGRVTVQPIAMYELGAALDNPSRRIVVGADPGYPRVADIHWQARLARPGLIVHASLDAVLDAVVAEVASLPRPSEAPAA